MSEKLGIPASEILDFSANINPRGLPAAAHAKLVRDAANAHLLGCYPDPSANSLRRALARHLDCAAESIVVGPGAESLLAPIVRCLQTLRALIPIPAFSEYRRVCTQENIKFIPFKLLSSEQFRLPVDCFREAIANSVCDLVILNNPHNPSGSMLSRAEVNTILETARSREITLLLDEAFIDYAAHESLVQEAAAKPGLIVVRSLTKFYGCPALRVGYAVAHPDTITRMKALLATWPVSQMAMDALEEALLDQEYARCSLRENQMQREPLSDLLATLGLTVYPSAANYLLFELQPEMPASSELRAQLINRHHILIRNCDSYEGLVRGRYVRVAVRSKADNSRLVKALAEELNAE
jgi:threonine-phosphate decarboxylase